MKEEIKIEQFNFYELYWDAIKDETNENIADMVTHICEYVFEDKDFDFDDNTMQVIWEDLKPVLTVQKQAVINKKKSVKYDRIWKHFAFTKSYFNKLKLMSLNDGGAYIKAICEQAFEGKIAKNLPPKAEKYYTLSRLTLDLSLTRKKSGSKGGKSKTNPKDKPAPGNHTIDDLKALGCTGNLSPENAILEGVDVNKLYDYVKSNSETQQLSLYEVVESYKNAVS